MITQTETSSPRHSALANVKRVVIKVGSAVIAANGKLQEQTIQSLADDVATLLEEEYEVVMVVSGAVAGGFRALGMLQPPPTVVERQAAACVGQYKMIDTFANAFAKHNREVAQILMMADDIENRRRFISARHTLQMLLNKGIVPIINENDPLADDENKIGDNDHLAALVSNVVSAQLLLILSSVPGVYRNGSKEVIPEVAVGSSVDEHISNSMSATGVGGMSAKVKAVHLASHWGIPAVIADGNTPGLVHELLACKQHGTIFLPRKSFLSSRKQWIAFRKQSKGLITVDNGAKQAIINNGASLLPSGIIEVQGRFSMGERIDIADSEGTVFAVGLTSYPANDVYRMRGKSQKDFEQILGYKYTSEIVDRDDMVLL